MRRFSTAVLAAAFLGAMLPGAVGAAAVIRYAESRAGAFCESPLDGTGYIYGFVDHNSFFGDASEISLWLDPAVAFDDPPTASGFAETVETSVAGGVMTVSSSVTLFDSDGNEIGVGTIEATLAAVGEPHGPDPFLPGNHKSWTEALSQDYEGTGTITIGDTAYELPCVGNAGETTVHENNPASFVFNNAGIGLSCLWIDDDVVVGLFARDDLFGSSAEAFYSTETAQAFGFTDDVTIDGSTFSAELQLDDEFGGDSIDAVAEAGMAPSGPIVTAFLDQQNGHLKSIQQPFSVGGSLELSNGMSLPINDEFCDAASFDNHGIANPSKGARAGGKPPVNDVPAGAIQVGPGTRLNALTAGTAFLPEAPNETCPEGQGDQMGNTLWYKLTGTGGTVTIDTSGSDFDTMVAAYRVDGDSLVEVACDDDRFDGALALSYQAIVPFATEAGKTYLVQIGGFRRFFDETAQTGRLRLNVR